MLLKYMQYLAVILIKRPSTYIIPLISYGALVGIFAPTLGIQSTPGAPAINNLLSYFYFLPFIFGSIFLTVKILNIFKEGEEDGSELLITSKKISRFQLVAGKFIMTYLILFLYDFLMFFIIYFVSFADPNASGMDRLKFGASWALGDFIILILLSSIIIFLASVMSKTGTLSLSIALPAALPIISFIINPVGNGSASKLIPDVQNYAVLTNNDNELDSNNFLIADRNPDQFDQDYDEYQSGFYKYLAPVDIWQHLNGFYRIFQNEEFTLQSLGTKWTKHEGEPENNSLQFEINNKNYYIVKSTSTFVNSNDLSISDLRKINYQEWTEALKTDETARELFPQNITSASLVDQITETKNLLTNNQFLATSFSKEQLTPYLDELKKDASTFKSDELATIILQIIHYNYENLLPALNNSESVISANGFTILNAEEINYLTPAKFVSTTAVIISYSVITILLAALVMRRYLKRDFK